jgi:uncharacterized protein
LENENRLSNQSTNNQLSESAPALLPPVIEPPALTFEEPPKKPGIWSFWPSMGFSAAIFAIYFFVQALVFIIFASIYIVGQYNSNTNLDLIRAIQNLTTNGLLLSLATIFSALGGTAAIILFVKMRKGISVSEYLGLKSFNNKTLIFVVILSIVLIVVSSYLDRLFPQSQNSNFTIEAYKTSVWPLLLGVAVVIFAPLFEEGFFRGFLFVGLKQTFLGGSGAILITSAGWAALHIQYDIYGIISIFALGIVLGIVRLKTNSLLAVLILHALWNLASITATALHVNGIGV